MAQDIVAGAYNDADVEVPDGAFDYSGFDFFSEIAEDAKDRPIGGVVYGETGSGKTSFVSQFPGILMAEAGTEKGVETLKGFGLLPKKLPFVRVPNWEYLQGLVRRLGGGEHQFKYLGLDSLSEFENLLFDYTCRTDFGGDWSSKKGGFHSYGDGYVAAVRHLEEMLAGLEDLRDSGVGVLWIGHSLVQRFDDPSLGSYDRYTVDMNKKCYATVKKWADTLLFLDFYTETEEDDRTKKVRAQGGDKRVLRVSRTAAYDAKNRYGLTQPIFLGKTAKEGFDSFKKAMSVAKGAND